jgi:dihydropteroate synthase
VKSPDALNSSPKTINVRGKLIDLSAPAVMGIVNVTPDSFFKGSRLTTEYEILTQTEKMLSEGAALIDVGGYSSRPGAEDISVEEELSRVVHAVQAIIRKFPAAIISVDTFRAEVAQRAVQEGASIINDISGGELDSNMFDTVAKLHVPYIIMHMRGTPQTMKSLTQYDNFLREVMDYFIEKINRLTTLGVKDIIIDPGFGFAKTIDQNFELLANLDKPILAGLSRKSMIWKTLGGSAEDSLNGTTALNMAAVLKGAAILRVHDVKQAIEAVTLYRKL